MLLKNSLSDSATSLFKNNTIIVLLLARMDIRSNSALKPTLIGEFFFAEFLEMFQHSSSSDSHGAVLFPVERIPGFIIHFLSLSRCRIAILISSVMKTPACKKKNQLKS